MQMRRQMLWRCFAKGSTDSLPHLRGDYGYYSRLWSSTQAAYLRKRVQITDGLLPCLPYSRTFGIVGNHLEGAARDNYR